MSVKKVNKTTGETTKVAGLVNSEKVNTMYEAFPSDASASNKLVSDSTVDEKISDAIADKADKVSSATNGNFAGLDANGNLTDSGKKASDFATAANLANYINENGAINQFDITLSNTKSVNTGGTWSDNAFTYRGLTYTVNDDNIVITGTPTDNSFFYLLAKNIPAGRYTFGGLKDAANIVWDGGFWIYNGSVETAISTGAAGNKNDFTVDLSSYTFDRIKFGIKRKSNTLTNDTIKLFIRKADINIDVNAPYAKTNRELTEVVSGTVLQNGLYMSITYTPTNDESWQSRLYHLYEELQAFQNTLEDNERFTITNLNLGTTALWANHANAFYRKSSIIGDDFSAVFGHTTQMVIRAVRLDPTETNNRFSKTVITYSNNAVECTDESNAVGTNPVSLRIVKYKYNV